MICSKCGQECADDMLFCTNCGEKIAKEAPNEPVEKVEEKAEVVQETATETVKAENKKAGKKQENGEEGKKKSKKGIIALALVAILLIIFVPKALKLFDNSYMKYSDKSIIDVVESDGDFYVCYRNGDRVKLDEEPEGGWKMSMDGSVVVYKNDNEELIIFKDGKEFETGIDEVKGYIVSSYGDTVAYFTDYEMAEFKIPYEEWYGETYYNTYHKEVGTLNLYDIKKKKNTEIADEVCTDSVVLSPDGKTVAYVAEYEVNEDEVEEFTGFYSVNGKDSEELGDDKKVFAISNKAKYIYYFDEDRICVHTKGDDVKLASDIDSTSVMLNEDYSEMMYVNKKGKTYITVKGGKEKKVADAPLSHVYLKDDAVQGYYSVSTGVDYNNIGVRRTCVDTLKERVFYSSAKSQVYYVMKNFESERIASDVYSMSDCIVADDGESLVYLDGTKVMMVTKFTKGGEKEKLEKVSKAESIFANGDLSMIYVLDEKGDLHYVKKNKETEVAEDVYWAEFSPDGKYLYFVEDEENLCYTKNGKKVKEIFSAKDGTLDVDNYNGVIFVSNYDEEETTLYSVKGKKVKELYTIEE